MCGGSDTSELVWLLIGKYFVNLTSVLVVHNSSLSSAINQDYVATTEASLKCLSQQGNPIAVHWINVAGLRHQSDFNELLLQHVDMGIQGYITILSSLVEFLYARWYATEHSLLRLKDRYYLFLSEYESPKDVLAQEILKLYPNHLLVSAWNYPDLELWTQKFVGVNDNLDAVHLDTYLGNGSFAKNSELYPNKLLDMMGRTLAVASITYIPYLVSYFVPEAAGDVDSIDPHQPKQSIIYSGSEADIVRSFCKLRNCTIKVMPYGKDNWGGIYSNGTSSGMIGSVYRNEAEFGIGCSYNWYNDIFETSIAIAKSAVTILGPAPSLYPAYMTNILPFSNLIWSLTILSIICSSLVKYCIEYCSSRMNYRPDAQEFKHCSSYLATLFEVLAIFVEQSFPKTRVDFGCCRLFLSALLLAGLTLQNIYSGQLKSLLTVPLFMDPVDTIKKFALTDWQWGAPAIAWVLTIAESDIPYEQIMKNKFEIRNYEELRNSTFRHNYGLSVERLHGGTYSFGDYIRDGNLDEKILVDDDLFFDWTRAFAIRGWPLMEVFNTHILWCLEHGLYKYWEWKHVSNYLDKKVQQKFLDLAAGHTFSKTTAPISDISGPLIVLGFGYAFAFIAFFIEVLLRMFEKKNRLLRGPKIKLQRNNEIKIHFRNQK